MRCMRVTEEQSNEARIQAALRFRLANARLNYRDNKYSEQGINEQHSLTRKRPSMTDTQLLFAGPVFSLLTLFFTANPSTRPKFFMRAIGWLGACMLIPMVVGYSFQSYTLITLAFVSKPFTASLGGTLFVGYVVMWRSKRLPLVTIIPSIMLLCGSVADFYAVHKLANAWGGAQC